MNRFKFEEDDVRRTIEHLGQGPITANDIGLPKWAHRLKKPEVRKLAHGRQGLFEDGMEIVPLQRRERASGAHAQLRE